MMGSGYAASVMGANTPVAKAAVFAETSVWSPVSWLMIFCISLLAITIFALMGKYDRVSEKQTGEYEAKYDVFFGGEQSVYSQVGGSDLFWGFKHNWHGYFDFMHNLHSGIVNDYALWAIVALAIVTLFTLIVL